jgi:hypothetical protein
MADVRPQSFQNHRRVRPAYLAALGILCLNLLWSVYRVAILPSADALVSLLLAIALLIIALYTRGFALTVQNRIIRLEMRLRLRELLPADLQGRIREFSHAQLIALRFASDAELPDLCRQVLAEGLTDKAAIKKLIKDWQPDHLRA